MATTVTTRKTDLYIVRLSLEGERERKRELPGERKGSDRPSRGDERECRNFFILGRRVGQSDKRAVLGARRKMQAL